MPVVSKKVRGSGQAQRYTLYDESGDEVSSGRGPGPANIPLRGNTTPLPTSTSSPPSDVSSLQPGTIVQGSDRANGGTVGSTFQRVEVIQTPAGPQNTIRTYRIIDTPAGPQEVDITNQVETDPGAPQPGQEEGTLDPTGGAATPGPSDCGCDVAELPGGDVTAAEEQAGTTDLPNQSQYVVIRAGGRVDDPVATILNTDTGTEFTVREGDTFQGAAVSIIDIENKTVQMDDGTQYFFVDEERERDPIDPSRYQTDYIRGLANGVAQIFDNETNRGWQIGVGDTLGGFRVKTIDSRGITLEDGTVIQYTGIQTNPGGDGVDSEGKATRQGSPTSTRADPNGEVVAPMSSGGRSGPF